MDMMSLRCQCQVMTNATTPNTLARGQAVFGATDPIFGGINSVA